MSIALYPRWVSLFLLRGTRLSDPDGLLRGSGSRVRHLVVESAATLDAPRVRALVRRAVTTHPVPIPKGARRRLIVKSVSARQRPRRPRG